MISFLWFLCFQNNYLRSLHLKPFNWITTLEIKSSHVIISALKSKANLHLLKFHLISCADSDKEATALNLFINANFLNQFKPMELKEPSQRNDQCIYNLLFNV